MVFKAFLKHRNKSYNQASLDLQANKERFYYTSRGDKLVPFMYGTCSDLFKAQMPVIPGDTDDRARIKNAREILKNQTICYTSKPYKVGDRSSSPELIKHASESLAGRLGIIELGTFKVNEIDHLEQCYQYS